MLEPQESGQYERGMMVYPDRGWRWLFYRTPFWLWRMGAKPLMRRRMGMLTTFGRKSGQPRDTLLEYVELDGCAYLGAGWGNRAQWVKNILADPRVTFDSGMGLVRGRAVRVVDGEIMRRLYPEMKKSPVWAEYTASWGVDGDDVEDVAKKAARLWTFRVEPGKAGEEGEAPRPGGMDLWWVTVVVVVAVVAVAAI